MKKKIIALISCVIITFTIYSPISSFAEDSEEPTEPVKATQTTENTKDSSDKKEETTTTPTTQPPTTVKETKPAKTTKPAETTTTTTKATETTKDETVEKEHQKIDVKVYKDSRGNTKDSKAKFTVEGKLPKGIIVSVYPEKEDATLGYRLVMENADGDVYRETEKITIEMSSEDISKLIDESESITVKTKDFSGNKTERSVKTNDSKIKFDASEVSRILVYAKEKKDTENDTDVEKPNSDSDEDADSEVKKDEESPVKEEKEDSNDKDLEMMAKAEQNAIDLMKSPIRALAGDEAQTYNIVINYIFGDNSIAHDPYLAVVLAGEDFDETVTIPTIPGYEAYYNDAVATTVHLTYTDIQQNQTVYVTYRPVQVGYQVRHYWQNADNDYYTLHETENLMGYTGDTAEATAKAYQGFAVLAYQEPQIAADGSTVVEIYYDREYCLMRFNLDGGYGVDPIYKKWGATVSVGEPSKNGYTFNGWDQAIPQTMPYGGGTYTAQWTATGSTYTIIYWKENANDENYSYWGSEEKTTTSGSTVSATDAIPNSIANGEAQYFTFNSSLSDSNVTVSGDGTTIVNVYYDRNVYTITLINDSGNDYICGFEEHTHTYDSTQTLYYGGCYPTDGGTTRTCGYATEHTHVYSCWRNTSSRNRPNNNQTTTLNNTYGQTIGIIGYLSNTGYKYVYTGTNGWYRYTGSATAGTILAPDGYNCPGYEHTHSYESVATIRTGGCYPDTGGTVPICGKQEHTHTSACRGTLIYRITAKYGADILNQWTFTGADGTNYPTTSPISSWYPVKSSIYSERLYNIPTMPGEHSIFRLYTSTNSTKTYYYCVEALPGQTADRTYNNVNYVYHQVVTVDYNRYTKAEDFYNIDGFTQFTARTENGTNMGNSYSLTSGASYYLYYSRNQSSISYKSAGETLTHDANGNSLTTSTYTQVPYQTPLSSYDITPPYPDHYPVNAYSFGGWYDNSDFAGSPYDFSGNTMPTENLALFAKWVPQNYTIKIYKDKATAEIGADPITTMNAYYGDTIPAQPEPTPDHEEYVFSGWFYTDGDTEKPWTFGATQVTKDVKIYAKWTSNTIRPYNVYFQDVNGNDLATPIHSSGYAGSTRTFNASANVPQGYFPRVKSHSILIDIDGTDTNGLNDYTFIYDHSENLPYTVHYIDERTGEKLLPDKVVSPNLAVRVTEKFRSIPEYIPDSFQKHLTLSVTGTNEITFYYTKDSVHAFYLTSHYVEEVDGTWSLYNSLETWATIGHTVNAVPMTIQGYTLDTSVQETVQSGTVSASGLELKLYYTRNQYPYTVKYIDSRTGLALHAPKNAMGKVDTTVTETAETIEGYDCTNGPTQSKVIQVEDDPQVAVRNIITFYYQVQQAEFNYIPVGNGTVSLSQEYVAAVNGTVQGSTAIPGTNQTFVGWFTDENCQIPVTSTLATVNGNTITPVKANGRYNSQNFYAKFRPSNIDVSVVKNGTDGTTGLSAGYTLYEVLESGGTTILFNGLTKHIQQVDTFTTPDSISLEMGKSYILQETAAPNGYNQWNGKAMLTVDSSGGVTITKEFSANLISYSSGTLTLSDEPIEAVPSGFTQKQMPYVWGLIIGIIILLSLMLFIRRITNNKDVFTM